MSKRGETKDFSYSFDESLTIPKGKINELRNVTVEYPNVRGKIPSYMASRLRTMLLEAKDNPNKVVPTACTYDALTSRLAEEAGLPIVFLAGYPVASTHGLPDTGYIACAEMVDKIVETKRQINVPMFVDGDTGYGSPMNVKRTVECYAHAGAAGVMIEDQTWPKRCGHTKGKSVVSRGEAYARIQAAVDARNEGHDIVILARTDALILGWEEVVTRAKEFLRIGVDAIFIEALPDREAMKLAAETVKAPLLANIIEGGRTENLSAKDLAHMGFAAVGYPWRLVASHLQGTRKALESLQDSMTTGAPPVILGYDEVCYNVGFNKYWEREERYKFDQDNLLNPIVNSETNGQNGVH